MQQQCQMMMTQQANLMITFIENSISLKFVFLRHLRVFFSFFKASVPMLENHAIFSCNISFKLLWIDINIQISIHKWMLKRNIPGSEGGSQLKKIQIFDFHTGMLMHLWSINRQSAHSSIVLKIKEFEWIDDVAKADPFNRCPPYIAHERVVCHHVMGEYCTFVEWLCLHLQGVCPIQA